MMLTHVLSFHTLGYYPQVVYKTDFNWLTLFPSNPMRNFMLWFHDAQITIKGFKHLAVSPLTLCSLDTMLQFTTGSYYILMLPISVWELARRQSLEYMRLFGLDFLHRCMLLITLAYYWCMYCISLFFKVGFLITELKSFRWLLKTKTEATPAVIKSTSLGVRIEDLDFEPCLG